MANKKFYKLLKLQDDIVYHGSSHKLTVIRPQASRLLNGEKAVFATRHRSVALCFAGGIWSDSDIELGAINDQLYIKELKKNSFDKFLSRAGYIYTLENNDFKSDERIQNFEVYSLTEKIPIKVDLIINLLKELEKEDIDIEHY